MRVLGIDPGESTGWALIDGSGEVVSQGVIPNAAEGALGWASLAMPAHDVMVIESFIAEPNFVGRVHASEVIGVFLAMSPAKKVFQSRSQKATLIRGTETERFSWMRSKGFSGMSHEMDAICHCLIYLRRSGNVAVYERYFA